MAEEIRILKDFIEKKCQKRPRCMCPSFDDKSGRRQDFSSRNRGKTGNTGKRCAESMAVLGGTGLFRKRSGAGVPAKAIPSERPQYSPAELSCYLKREDVKRLFQSAQQKLGKTLSSGDMATLFSFYDWLGLPLEVIDLLLTYCVSRGKRGCIISKKLPWAGQRKA